jgi:hypothetical protein
MNQFKFHEYQGVGLKPFKMIYNTHIGLLGVCLVIFPIYFPIKL